MNRRAGRPKFEIYRIVAIACHRGISTGRIMRSLAGAICQAKCPGNTPPARMAASGSTKAIIEIHNELRDRLERVTGCVTFRRLDV